MRDNSFVYDGVARKVRAVDLAKPDRRPLKQEWLPRGVQLFRSFYEVSTLNPGTSAAFVKKTVN
jgi:hypothetical protein